MKTIVKINVVNNSEPVVGFIDAYYALSLDTVAIVVVPNTGIFQRNLVDIQLMNIENQKKYNIEFALI